jgi:minimal PKS acyl carrier protein
VTRSEITATELAELLEGCAGVPSDPADLIGGVTFADLGVDSLGIIGIIAEVERRYGVAIPEEAEKILRPVDFLNFINMQLVKAA